MAKGNGIVNSHPINGGSRNQEPLKLSGALGQIKSKMVTPILGTEFPDAHVAEWLRAPNSDDLIRDLAITGMARPEDAADLSPYGMILTCKWIASRRGVVFFRGQIDLTDELQKELIQRMGELSGKPADSHLHIHPLVEGNADVDHKVNIITSDKAQGAAEDIFKIQADRPMGTRGSWHADISYEPHPSDYSSLKVVKMPATGGDTMWASSYEILERISPAYRKFLESLTVTMAQTRYESACKAKNIKLYTDARGSPANVGTGLGAVHPMVRTNPVTGWKGVFGIGGDFKQVNELAPDESRRMQDWLLQLLVENHDLQLRHQWKNPYDIAIWDNRSVFHSAILDHGGMGPRTGHRVVGVGERAYFDPNSKLRSEALAEERANA
ncbi:alpha-ketoglutarate-dependent sulfonate dioxygenase [Penicillium alfredii]|uniref:Alpha-ketoglutarate-dependent sulfonate dioxygenase n=1 Tax=Penicillium alfredii TaxID=1506179 RepID=A0A9W9K7L2_9EURO|nr:alpha-ketoglutarate-dependent sulfonate dioxygenase [Penicillium alfredii]KAJ5095775.1 alpha-ketoglutarate-dependent sulfonate dioxygenase [Penicillium alfredii]